MEELALLKDVFGIGAATAFAIVFGVVFAVRKTSIDDVNTRLIRVESDLKWIKRALGAKEEDE